MSIYNHDPTDEPSFADMVRRVHNLRRYMDLGDVHKRLCSEYTAEQAHWLIQAVILRSVGYSAKDYEQELVATSPMK